MKCLISLLGLLLFQSATAQVIAAFSGTSTPSVATVNDISASALSRGSGITASTGSTFNSTGWTTSATVDLADYIEWTITADSNFSITVTSMTINYDRDALFIFGSGPQQLVIRSSVDGYTSNIFSDTSVNINGETVTFSTSQTSGFGGSITYRLYGFNAATGFFGSNFGTFDIEGGLGTILGLANTGISISGTVNYDGLFYDGTTWTPSAPDATTGSTNAIIANGSYTITSDVEVEALEIRTAGTLLVNPGNALTVNGDLMVDGTLTLNSVSNTYASLIPNGTVTTSGTRAITYQRYVNSNANGNDLIAPPLNGQSWQDFLASGTNSTDLLDNDGTSPGTLYAFGPFEKSSGTYLTWADTAVETLTSGTGYRVATDAGTTLTFAGDVLTSAINVAIEFSGPAFQDWNLVGNPYPSYISMDDFLEYETASGATNAELLATGSGIYGYDGNASDGWDVVTAASGRLMAPGQGFLVPAASDLDGDAATLTFHPDMRRTGSSDDFILGRNAEVLTFLKLKASTANKSYNTQFYFNNDSSLGLDQGYDGKILGTVPGFALYSQLVQDNTGLPIALQSLHTSDLASTTVIPLGVRSNAGEQITFTITESTLPNTVEVYLEDTATNTFTLLNSRNYTLLPNEALNGTGRFYLRFGDAALSNTEATLNDLNIYTNQKDYTIIITGQLSESTTARLYDLQGRLVNTTQLVSSSYSQTIDVSNLSSGVYVVQLSNSSKKKTQKVILH